jgi:hypothetical protein
MSNHFSMGAINKSTDKYEYPKIANKSNKYKCPFCEKDVIFRNGKIKQPHFAHYKSNSPCSYYEKPNETQIHKDAKLLMKTLFNNKQSINIYKKCYSCYDKQMNVLKINDEDYRDNIDVVIEYKFDYNNSKRSADIALLKNKELKYIFEICYKHKTKEENRPEPWFEIKADTFINSTNSGENINEKGEIEIECIREYKCNCCKEKEEYSKYIYIKFLEKLRIKEKEQKLEQFETILMGKEDYITIKLQMKLENEKIKRENEYKEREIHWKKILEERKIQDEKDRKELEDKQKRINEYNTKILELNKICSICKINYCKCLTNNFIKNKYNISICSSCNKKKCKCIRITNFFK